MRQLASEERKKKEKEKEMSEKKKVEDSSSVMLPKVSNVDDVPEIDADDDAQDKQTPNSAE